jgi:RIO kinase 1
MHDPLAPLVAEGIVDEVVSRLRGGKEADVWLVRSGGQVVAAKVYKARQARSFKNDAAYKEGRRVRNTRTQRAMDRGSRFGRAAAEDAWKAKESDALFLLHAAGLRVPRPVLFHEGVLLMEVVVDERGHPAPRLVDARLAREQAAAVYAELRKQAIGMLTSGLIHGDLSPYNVLLGAHGPVVIDFPQVIDAAHNSQAERFFVRDLENVRRFCAALDPAIGGEGDAREIWRAWVRRELTPGFVPTGNVPEAPKHAAPRTSTAHHRQAASHRQEAPHRQARAHGAQHGAQRGGRHAPAPEVIRVGRLPQVSTGGQPGRGSAPPAAAQGAAPGAGPAGDSQGHRRRRRRRRGNR